MAEAEAWVREQSYQRALEVYQQAPDDLAEADQRWVEFRRLDLGWKIAVGRQEPSQTVRELSEHLQRAFPSDAESSQRDRTWAEAQESLGNLELIGMYRSGRGTPSSSFLGALEWWAGQPSSDEARARYLAIVARWISGGSSQRELIGPLLHQVPWIVLDNTVRVAQSHQERAWAHLIRAIRATSLTPPDLRALHRVEEDFTASRTLAREAKVPWLDSVLYFYADWLGQYGLLEIDDEGGWNREPDWQRAAAVHTELVREFTAQTSMYWRRSRDWLEQVAKPSVSLHVPGAFLPESVVSIPIQWRNVTSAVLRAYPVDLQTAQRTPGAGATQRSWWDSVSLSGVQSVEVWSGSLSTKQNHAPGNREIVWVDKLKPGAYVLEIEGKPESEGGSPVRARAGLVLSDIAVTLKTTENSVLVWVTHVTNGEPVPGARVQIVPLERRSNTFQPLPPLVESTKPDGTAVFEQLKKSDRLLVAVRKEDRQATTELWQPGSQRTQTDWLLYVHADRPAFRPGETVFWKVIARRRVQESVQTPSGESLKYQLIDPRGNRAHEGVIELNEFGTGTESWVLPENAALGLYQIEFQENKPETRSWGQSPLFRAEAYRLPEFQVTVRARDSDSDPDSEGDARSTASRSYLLGETVELEIDATYYFGSPVVNAEVEVRIDRSAWHPIRPLPRPGIPHQPSISRGMSVSRFPVDDLDFHRSAESTTLQFSGRTDSRGRFTVSVPTELADGDSELHIEARVVDASRREVTGRGRVRVTSQRYYVELNGKPRLVRLGEPVQIQIRSHDAEDRPVSVQGKVVLSRRTWKEVWWDPQGREVTGSALQELRANQSIWPPPGDPGLPPWRIKERGYEEEILRTESIETASDGTVVWSFRPEREGYYHIAWSSPGEATRPASKASETPPRHEPLVTAQTHVWVAESRSTDVGYRTDGIELIFDREAFREGRTAPVMVVSRSPGRHVLFTIEMGSSFEHRVLKLTGTTRLIEIPISERHVPNIRLSAILLDNLQLHQAQDEIQIPATQRRLSIQLVPNRESYEPGSPGTVRVQVRDSADQPIQTELAVSVVDESVFAIQDDLAGDPVSHFFERHRMIQVQTTSSLLNQPHLLIKKPKDSETAGVRRLLLPPDADYQDGLGSGMGGGADGMRYKVGGGDLLTASRAQGLSLPRSAAGVGGELMMAESIPMAPAFGMAMDSASGEDVGESETVMVVRSDFRTTALWEPNVVTDTAGEAEVSLTYPDSTTQWRLTARGVSKGPEIGLSTTKVRSGKPLIVRLQHPRFLIENDRSTVSAVVNNPSDESAEVRVRLKWQQENVSLIPISPDGKSAVLQDSGKVWVSDYQVIRVDGGGQERVDFPVSAARPGDVELTVEARSGDWSDAMQRRLTVHARGLEQLATRAGKSTEDEISWTLSLPERQSGRTRMQVLFTPSLAVSLLDALPYLADFPHGCTEQTLSRFLPAVVVRSTLKQFGLDADAVMEAALKGTTGQPVAQAPAFMPPRSGKPRDLTQLDRMIQDGLARLKDQQNQDGSWGWWPGGTGDVWMTAYVVWGLALVQQFGVDAEGIREREAVNWLRDRLLESASMPEMQAFVLHALSAHRRHSGLSSVAVVERQAWDRCYQGRGRLAPYGLALLILSGLDQDRKDEVQVLARNLENSVRRDDAAQTGLTHPSERTSATGGSAEDSSLPIAHWGVSRGWNRWMDGPVESTAFCLQALLRVQPDHPLVEPATQWLLRNRRAASWNNTRDTALAILALNEFLLKSGEGESDQEWVLEVNGSAVITQDFSKLPVHQYSTLVDIPEERIQDVNQFKLRRVRGSGPMYYSTAARFFGTADPIEPLGNEVFLRRDVFRLTPQPTLLQGVVDRRMPLQAGDSLKSGERLEVVLTVETKNDLEYLMFEDLKAAAFESVEIRSGRNSSMQGLTPTAGRMEVIPGKRDSRDFGGRSVSVHSEWQDRAAVFFVDRLPGGFWELRFVYRVETPGVYTVLPAVGQAMYVPEIRANSASSKVDVAQ